MFLLILQYICNFSQWIKLIHEIIQKISYLKMCQKIYNLIYSLFHWLAIILKAIRFWINLIASKLKFELFPMYLKIFFFDIYSKLYDFFSHFILHNISQFLQNWLFIWSFSIYRKIDDLQTYFQKYNSKIRSKSLKKSHYRKWLPLLFFDLIILSYVLW